MSGVVRAATQQVEDALLQEYDQIAGGVSKYALLAQKYGLDSESSFMHKMRRARARRQSAEATSTISVHEAMARLAAIQAARVGQERKQADPSGSKPRAREQAKEDALLVRYEELLVHRPQNLSAMACLLKEFPGACKRTMGGKLTRARERRGDAHYEIRRKDRQAEQARARQERKQARTGQERQAGAGAELTAWAVPVEAWDDEQPMNDFEDVAVMGSTSVTPSKRSAKREKEDALLVRYEQLQNEKVGTSAMSRLLMETPGGKESTIWGQLARARARRNGGEPSVPMQREGEELMMGIEGMALPMASPLAGSVAPIPALIDLINRDILGAPLSRLLVRTCQVRIASDLAC